jgi:hypothetical protein
LVIFTPARWEQHPDRAAMHCLVAQPLDCSGVASVVISAVVCRFSNRTAPIGTPRPAATSWAVTWSHEPSKGRV